MRDADLSRSIEYRRMEQVMIILNNLSFDESNAEFMAAKSPVLFEFLILALYFHPTRPPFVNLKRHSLDILTNIAKKLKLKRLSASHRTLLIRSLYQLIVVGDGVRADEDKLDVIRGLEILSKLSGRGEMGDDELSNDRILAKYEILGGVITRLANLLTSQDVLIVLHALECLYNVTLYNKVAFIYSVKHNIL
jgi:hypothetical protein